MARLITKRGTPGQILEGATARYTTVGDLRRRGFNVLHVPRDGNEGHVRVEFPGPWTEDVAIAFDECFEEGEQSHG